MMFDVKATEGVVSGRVDGDYMDAAVSGGIAGLEVSLDRMSANTTAREGRARLTLTLDMTPETMRQMALLLADKSGMPAFTERDWRRISEALESSGQSDLSARIRDAYGWA